MSGDFPVTSKIVSLGKCNEKPWDLWVSEIGHTSPKKDDDGTFAAPASVEKAGRRGKRAGRRRAAVSRLPAAAMALHAQFPHGDALRAALCPLCGAAVHVAAAARHLALAHADQSLPPPQAPALRHKTASSRSRHKKEPPLPLISVDLKPMETSPAHSKIPPLSRVVIPQPEVQYLEEPSTSASSEVQVCVGSGEPPVVSIQDTDDLLGENITDDIFAIMNSEGIQSADNITDAADWKNIIKAIGSMQDLNFSQPTDSLPTPDLYAPVDAATLSAFSLAETELQLPPPAAPPPPPPPRPAPPTPTTPAKSSHSRSKTSKSKCPQREYDPNKHCGVVTTENPKPCTRSLTCKAHALSLRRTVVGRVKPFDTLLAEHRAARDAPAVAAAAAAAAAAAPAPPAEPEPRAAGDEAALPGDPAPELLCWYSALPRPLALCTYNAAAAGGAITLGKRFATVRSSIKAALARPAGKAGGAGGSRAARPELRRLVTARGPDRRTNGHVEPRPGSKHAVLGLAFLDPLLADDKC